MRLSLLILFLLFINWNLAAQDSSLLEVQTIIDKPEVTTGDFVLYQIEVVHPTQVQLQRVSLPQLPQWIDIEPLEPQVISGKPLEDDTSVFKKLWPFDDSDSSVQTTTWSWLLWPTQEGELSIPAISIISQETQGDDKTPLYQGRTNPIIITVRSFLDTSNPDQPPVLRIPKSLPPPPTSIPWLWIIVGFLVLVGISIFLLIYKKRKKNLPTEKQETPYEGAMRRLKELEQFILNNPTQIHHYYFQLSEIFREYLEKCFEFPAASMTSQEFLPLLEKKTPYTIEERNKIALLTQKSDLIKYAEALPTKTELESSYNEVVALIEAASYSIPHIGENDTMQPSGAAEVS